MSTLKDHHHLYNVSMDINIKKLNEAIMSKGIKKQWMADKIGVSRTTLHNWMVGSKRPSEKNLHEISKVLGVEIDFLSDNIQNKKNTWIVKVPIIDLKNIHLILKSVQIKNIKSEDYIYIEQTESDSELFAITLDNDTMSSSGAVTFPEGCKVIINTKKKAGSNDYVLTVDEKTNIATFKKLVLDGNKKYLKPLNSSYKAEPLARNQKIIGVAVAQFSWI